MWIDPDSKAYGKIVGCFKESIPFPIHDSLKRSGLSFTYSAFAEPIMAC